MRWKVMVSAPYMSKVIDQFRPLFEERQIDIILPEVNERMEEDQLLALVGDIDGAICGDDRFTERVLAAAPKLKVISKWGTGIDSIDKEACQKYGIVLANTPNAFSEPVADNVLGYMLCFARQLPFMDKHMKNGVWHKIPGRTLRECTLGVIGVGDAGKAVIRRASAFDMRILGNDPITPPQEFLDKHRVEMVSKEELLKQADFVSVNCDLNSSSYHLMGDTEFRLMKNDAIMINTARGPIVDEQALIRALQNGEIAGAGMDVFEFEPLPKDSPLLKMDNVLLAPHNANSSPEAWERVHANTLKNLFDVLEGVKS